jgi:hypothetical protein
MLKKIGMRNPLHRKKLQLCLNGLCMRQSEANILDTHWVQSMLISIDYFSIFFLKNGLMILVYLNIKNILLNQK